MYDARPRGGYHAECSEKVLLARWGSFSDSESGIGVTAIAVFLVEEMHTEVVDMILAATTKIR